MKLNCQILTIDFFRMPTIHRELYRLLQPRAPSLWTRSTTTSASWGGPSSIFLDAQASRAPIGVSPMVRHTFSDFLSVSAYEPSQSVVMTSWWSIVRFPNCHECHSRSKGTWLGGWQRLPNFIILTEFHNFDWISQFLLNFTISTTNHNAPIWWRGLVYWAQTFSTWSLPGLRIF